MTEEDRVRLIRQAKTGDAEAFAEVFEAYRSVSFAIACRLVGETDADDVIMESYLKAWKALSRFNEKSSVKTWLYRIIHNCALDFLRKNKRQQGRMVQLGDGENERSIQDLHDESQPTAVESIEKAETSVQIAEALKQLSEELRSTLLLRFADGLSYAEIAAALGISIGTVMSRLFNGKKKLRKILQGMDD